MTVRVVTTKTCDADVEAAIAYYVEAVDEELAGRFVDALEFALRRVAAFPESGSAGAEAMTGVPGLRSAALDGFPFRLFFTCDDDAVRVHRLLHDRRDPGRAFDR